jgi:tungstate transport system substrate-binding protein
VGTGKALKLGENGDVDIVLVHSRPDEDKFVDQGHGVNRRDVMYNDFVVVGPKNDSAGVRGMKDAIAAFKKIEAAHVRFISRGDDSGTDKMEKRIWELAHVMPQKEFYLSAGRGMGEVLTMANDLQGYTLSDRGTYIAYRQKLDLEILVANSPPLFNPYGIIAVNPRKYPNTRYREAMLLIDWITSEEGQKAIADFKVNGEQLFFPNAKKVN